MWFSADDFESGGDASPTVLGRSRPQNSTVCGGGHSPLTPMSHARSVHNVIGVVGCSLFSASGGVDRLGRVECSQRLRPSIPKARSIQ